MGSFFGNIGNALKKGVTDVGHFAGKVASNPIVDAGIGLIGGPGAAAAAGGLGRLLAPGGNIGEAAKGAAIGGAAGYGASKIGGALSGGGSMLDKAKGVLGAGASAAPMVSGASGGGGGLPDWLSGIGGYLTGNGGGNALAIAQGANATMLGKKSSDLADEALTSAKDNYAERAPLRTAGIAGMLNPGQGIAAKLASVPNHNLYGPPASLAPANAMPATPRLAPAQRAV